MLLGRDVMRPSASEHAQGINSVKVDWRGFWRSAFLAARLGEGGSIVPRAPQVWCETQAASSKSAAILPDAPRLCFAIDYQLRMRPAEILRNVAVPADWTVGFEDLRKLLGPEFLPFDRLMVRTE